MERVFILLTMGFSFKVAPGMRVRASSRGVRASVGPRAARVHFGSGRTGLSTGAGPVSLYTSLGGGGGRRRSAGPSHASAAVYQRQLRAAEKARQVQQLAAAFEDGLGAQAARDAETWTRHAQPPNDPSSVTPMLPAWANQGGDFTSP